MRLYIAGDNKLAAEYVALKAAAAGHRVVSTWHTPGGEPPDFDEDGAISWRSARAARRLGELKNASVLVLLPGSRLGSGAELAETGAAIGLGIPVLIVGRRLDLPPLWYPLLSAATTVDDLLIRLEGLEAKHLHAPTQEDEQTTLKEGSP